MERINELPLWIECYHKDNKRKRFLEKNDDKQYKNCDYYKFAIICNNNYKNSDAYIAGYFRYKNYKLYTDISLFSVCAIFPEETYKLALEAYKIKVKNGEITQQKHSIDKWENHSPYD